MKPLEPVVPLGPFDLVGQIGRGGMGRVYRARHRAQGLDVAVKILDAARTDDVAFRRAFEAEVHSVAGLDHPGIVLVFDHGRVPRESAEVSDGALVEGSPYLVMELAAGGSLADLSRTLDWATLRAVLRVLLDALAHAHARGVVHRDIKRSNVLVGLHGDSRSGLKLSDFGLAHRLSELSGVRSFEREAVGTPNYMSPEQVQARFRDYGPWTDLYALGCLAWTLSVGSPPYTGSAVEVMAAHVRNEPGEFTPAQEMPPGLEPWIRRLLHKETWRRYQCAADALLALDSLGQPAPGSEVQLPMRRGGTAPVAAAVSTLTWTLGATADLASAPTEPGRTAPADPVPRFPESWRGSRDIPAAPRMLGVGLGLFGIRRLRFVDRDELRQALWSELGDVHRSGEAKAVLVGGESGHGKSRGARWLAERAAELGLARVVRVACGPAAGRQQGLGSAVDRELGLKGLDRAGCRERISDLLRRYGAWQARLVVDLLEVVRPLVPGGPGQAAERRYEAVASLLDLMASRRPVIVWIEDLHFDADLGRLVAAVLDRQPAWPAPLLLLATHRPSSVDSDGASAVRALTAHARTLSMRLGPLPAAAERELVEDQLGLAPRLADRVLARTAGNPMFAEQLVSAWIQRHELVPTSAGFVLREGAQDDLPDDIHVLWRRRIESTTAHLGDDGERALELAAVLGREVDDQEWQAACARAGVSAPQELASALFEHGLARRHRDGWGFTHGMLRESVERRSRERLRWRRANRSCAEALTGLGAPDPLRRAHRLARLWTAADEPLRAALANADGLAATGRVVEAGQVAESMVEQAHAAGASAQEAAARLHIAVAVMRERRYEDAIVVLEAALSLFDGLDDGAGSVQAGRLLARCLANTGRVEEAVARGRAALRRAEEVGEAAPRAQVLMTLGAIVRRLGRAAEAEKLVSGAAAILQRAGERLQLAEAWLLLADIRRRRNDLDGAEDMLNRCRQLWIQAGSLYAGTVDLNLALLDVERERFPDALQRLGPAIELADAERDAFVSCAGRVLALRAHAGLGSWDRAVGVLEQLDAAERFMADDDIAAVAEDAGDAAARADQRPVALRCWGLARTLWREVGNRPRLLKTEAKLDELITSWTSLEPVSDPST